MEASYAVFLLVAKSKKPHNIAEIVLDKKAVDNIRKVQLSNATVSRRTTDIPDVIITQIVEKLKIVNRFSIQIDQSTVIGIEAKLIGFFRYHQNDDISELIMFCKHLQSFTTGEEIFNVIDLFFSEHNLSWNF